MNKKVDLKVVEHKSLPLLWLEHLVGQATLNICVEFTSEPINSLIKNCEYITYRLRQIFNFNIVFEYDHIEKEFSCSFYYNGQSYKVEFKTN